MWPTTSTNTVIISLFELTALLCNSVLITFKHPEGVSFPYSPKFYESSFTVSTRALWQSALPLWNVTISLIDSDASFWEERRWISLELALMLRYTAERDVVKPCGLVRNLKAAEGIHSAGRLKETLQSKILFCDLLQIILFYIKLKSNS